MNEEIKGQFKEQWANSTRFLSEGIEIQRSAMPE